MSYFLKNILRVLREVRSAGVSGLPSLFLRLARPKLQRLLIEGAYRSRLSWPLASRLRGKGIALMFHEIHDDVDAELRTGCNADQLEQIILAAQKAGRDIVSIDEGLRRLEDPTSDPFALLTFDDAYRDNVANALPVLERHQVPMTLFVPDGLLDRSAYAWWLGLRELLKTADHVAIEAMGAEFQLVDLPSKIAAMRQITAWIGTDQSRAEALRLSFEAHGIDIPGLIERYVMPTEELTAFARHPLVTVGAHTSSHRFLSNLSDDECLSDLAQNKSYLEALLGQPVAYLAYPYGTETACGQREADFAARLGFKASFTTRPGQVFEEHLKHPQLMPRIDMGFAWQSASQIDARLSGLHRWMENGFSEPVALLR